MGDPLYMLLGLALIVLVLVVYVLVAFVRYRRAVRRARSAPQPVIEDAREAYLGSAAEQADDVFAVRAEAVSPIADTASRPESAPESEPAPLPTREADSEPEPVVRPAPEPEAQPEPEHATEPEAQPESESTPESEPAPESEPEPAPSPESGYSLAEELELLMSAASQSAPLLTPEEHAAAVSSTATAREASAPDVSRAAPLVPEPSRGQALSHPATPAAIPVTEAAGLPAADALPARLPAIPEAPAVPEAPVATGNADDAVRVSESGATDAESASPTYTLVAPIELHFTAGEARVGVRAGTRTYGEFQRLAGILLDDLRKARGW